MPCVWILCSSASVRINTTESRTQRKAGINPNPRSEKLINMLRAVILLVVIWNTKAYNNLVNVFESCDHVTCSCRLISWWRTNINTVSVFSVVDLEKNDGSAARPYYMSSSLRSILNKKNHRRTKERKRGGALRQKWGEKDRKSGNDE